MSEAVLAGRLKGSELDLSVAMLSLWGESDEAASEKWRQEKIADFEAGGKTKETHETMEKLLAFLDKKVYGPGGTMAKTLKVRGNPRCFFDMTVGGEDVHHLFFWARKRV